MENIVALKTKVQVKQATSLVACTWPTRSALLYFDSFCTIMAEFFIFRIVNSDTHMVTLQGRRQRGGWGTVC